MTEQKVQHVLQTTLTFQIMREIQSKHQPPPKKKRLTNNFSDISVTVEEDSAPPDSSTASPPWGPSSPFTCTTTHSSGSVTPCTPFGPSTSADTTFSTLLHSDSTTPSLSSVSSVPGSVPPSAQCGKRIETRKSKRSLQRKFNRLQKWYAEIQRELKEVKNSRVFFVDILF